jgi:hypothetical protein
MRSLHNRLVEARRARNFAARLVSSDRHDKDYAIDALIVSFGADPDDVRAAQGRMTARLAGFQQQISLPRKRPRAVKRNKPSR